MLASDFDLPRGVSELCRAERIAALNFPRLQPGGEPARALLRGAMGEGVGQEEVGELEGAAGLRQRAAEVRGSGGRIEIMPSLDQVIHGSLSHRWIVVLRCAAPLLATLLSTALQNASTFALRKLVAHPDQFDVARHAMSRRLWRIQLRQ
jgi:hypothetical protein